MKKLKTKKADQNQIITKHGSARFYAPVRARSEWADPKVPEYKANWFVRFRCCGESWEQTAGPAYPVRGGLADVMQWAETVLRVRHEALKAGKLEELERVVRPARAVMLSEVGRVYLATVPPGKMDYRKNWYRLLAIATETLGLPPEEIAVDERTFNRKLLMDWIRLRQEHFRRGWSVRGAAPENAWEVLRAELRAVPPLPGIDKSEVMECNTTIRTYLRCARAVFANEREYLEGLVLPKLEQFLKWSPEVVAPKGHREIPAEVVERMLADLPRLREQDPPLWAFAQIVIWTGARSCQVRQMRGDALRVDGIQVPEAKGGESPLIEVAPEVLAELREIATPRSVLGAKAPGAVYRRFNKWLRFCGLKGTLAAHALRHVRLQQYRTELGVDVAAAAGGHRTTDMIQQNYTAPAKVVPMLVPWERAAG